MVTSTYTERQKCLWFQRFIKSVFICIMHIFILLIFFTASAYWMLTEVFSILSPFFNDCKHSLFPFIFCYNRTFFRGRFCKKSYWNQKKNSRILSLKNDRTSFKTFVSRTFFPGDFFSTVKPLIKKTSKEFIKCRILHFLIMECCRYLVF